VSSAAAEVDELAPMNAAAAGVGELAPRLATGAPVPGSTSVRAAGAGWPHSAHRLAPVIQRRGITARPVGPRGGPTMARSRAGSRAERRTARYAIAGGRGASWTPRCRRCNRVSNSRASASGLRGGR
jgi:hypothetical protein